MYKSFSDSVLRLYEKTGDGRGDRFHIGILTDEEEEEKVIGSFSDFENAFEMFKNYILTYKK